MPRNRQEISRCPRCGNAGLDWPSDKHFVCPACGFTLYLNPAAAVAVIIECDGKLLLGVRKDDPCRGMLDLPGGFIDPGETAEEAARREVFEETGVALTSLDYLLSLPNRYLYRDITYTTLDIIFAVSLAQPPAVRPGDDLETLLWVPRAAVDLEAVAFASLREALRRYLAGEGCAPRQRLLATTDVTGVVAEIPAGHRHLRTTLTLTDGSTLTLQEATVAALVRAYTAVKTGPLTTRVVLRGRPVSGQKQGYADWQLLEEP